MKQERISNDVMTQSLGVVAPDTLTTSAESGVADDDDADDDDDHDVEVVYTNE